jgi:hypothetical protein
VTSVKIMTVENQKSVWLNREQNPRAEQDDGSPKHSQSACGVFPAHSNKATPNAILFSHVGSLSALSPLLSLTCCTPLPSELASTAGTTAMEHSPPPLAGVIAIVLLPITITDTKII